MSHMVSSVTGGARQACRGLATVAAAVLVDQLVAVNANGKPVMLFNKIAVHVAAAAPAAPAAAS
jgi:hypothetical protein